MFQIQSTERNVTYIVSDAAIFCTGNQL